jgi:hypothetical protein
MMLKTKPFYKWLQNNCADHKQDFVILYGFDEDEQNRIYRRSTIMRAMGYETQYPLADGERTIYDTNEIGIAKPATYNLFKHANCIGCLKAGRQHWYAVYCLRKDIFNAAKQAEHEIGYSIIKGVYLSKLEEKYRTMHEELHICPNDKMNSQTFWAMVDKALPEQICLFPCDCSF